ncbi:MAG: autotransporter-associated beta strand repeat-containing protein [Akkermansiaceae bacterium]|nr:autotransporter-associated beta strand repeat-containing protein [Akkermansiaceae bacterium]
MAACLLLAGYSEAPAQSPYQLSVGGYMQVAGTAAPASYDAGYAFYSAAWPLVGDYPRDNYFQSGLYGTWMFPDDGVDNIAPYTDIEGGLGWWYDRKFQTATPKFNMGGVAFGGAGGTIAPMHQWIFANGPGVGTTNGNGKFGVAQLSPWLLFPPDGLNLKQGTSGELFGYGYLPLPLTRPKATTAGHPFPTGNQSWTLFVNSGNFKGPLAFFTPFFWSQIKITYPELANSLLDSCGSGPNKSVAMETPHSIRAWASDTPEGRFARSMPVYYPVDPNGYSQLTHRHAVYDRTALWNQVAAWFDGTGPAASGNLAPSGTFMQSASGHSPVWSIRGSNELGTLDWNGLVAPKSATPQDMGYQWQIDQVDVVPWGNGSLVRLPEYHQGPLAATSSSIWAPIKAHDLPQPAAVALAATSFSNPTPRSSLVVKDNDPAWTAPGPASGPFRALLGDGSVVTYYWYRFADQPALQKADLTPAEREQMQVLARKIHREWKHDRDYIAPPGSGTLADLDPGQLVTPPLGMEAGYVPVAWQQDWGGSVANPGTLKFTAVPTNPVAGQPFSVTVRAETTSGAAQNVTSATLVQLSVASGNGVLGGTTVGTIPSGQSSVAISGVTYSAAEAITLLAAATCLSPGTSPELAFSNPSGQLNLFSRPASGIAINQATLAATLGCPGTTANITMFWGTSNEGNRTEAWEKSVSLGSFDNVAATQISHNATGLQPKTTYSYIFRATGASGTVWSSPVRSFKTLPLAPVITAHPASASRVSGATATFTVRATDAAQYQWHKGGTPLADGGHVSGATSAMLRLADLSAADAGSYHVVVANASGNATSNAAALSLVAATTLTWDATPRTANAQDGGGNWLGGNNWLNGSINMPWNDHHNAMIGSGGTGGTINPGSVTVNNLIFNNFSGTYTIGSGCLGVVRDVLYQSNGAAKITAVLSGSCKVTKNGSGTLTLDGVTANTYRGGTTVNAGTLVLGTVVDGISPACSFAAGSGPVTLNSGGQLHLHKLVPNNPLILNGGTVRVVNGWGAVWAGPVKVNQNTTLTADSTFSLELRGNISGAGGFTKTGNHTLTFSGTNHYSGSTTVQAGKLVYGRRVSVGPGPLGISSGASVELNYSGSRHVSSLTLNGVAQAAGTYGSSASPATFKDDNYFRGTGTITVTPPF